MPSNPFQFVVDTSKPIDIVVDPISQQRVNTENERKVNSTPKPDGVAYQSAGNVALEEAKNLLNRSPLGAVKDKINSTLASANSALNSIMNNPMGLAQEATRMLTFRRIVTMYYNGLSSVLKGKSPIQMSMLYDKIHLGHHPRPGYAINGNTGVYAREYPAYPSFEKFFHTTLGTDFYWGM